MKNIKILTGLRFYAALHVVFFHNIYLFGDMSKNIPLTIRNFIGKGESAVALFFILSGFILTHVYKDKLKSGNEKKNYLVARFARIYPLYLLGFLLDLPRGLSYFYTKYQGTEAFIKTVITSGAHLSLMQSWIPRLTPAWNSPAWSLSAEIFFYICLIFTMKFLLNGRKKIMAMTILYALPAIIYFTIFSVSASWTNTAAFSTFWRSFPAIRITDFFIGVLLYGLIIDNSNYLKIVEKNCSFFFWGSIAASLILTQFSHLLPEKLFAQVFLVPLFSMIILCSYYGNVAFSWIFENKIIQRLGLSSFAVYILHQPLKYYFNMFTEVSLVGGFIYFIGVQIICLVLYKFYEMPIQGLIRKRFRW